MGNRMDKYDRRRGFFMNKQDNQLTLSVIATLVAGIALIYTFIMFPHIIFAVAGISFVFIIAAAVLTQNIISFVSGKEKTRNTQIQNCIDDISTQMETMGNAQSQLSKATFLYTKQTAQTLSVLENNYAESQEALYKNLTALSNAQNKSTKLMIKYDQSNTTKVISTLKELRNQLSDTMIQGFDQIQPNNSEVVEALEDIVNYLKSQSNGIDQTMGLQLNNVAHELQNISNSIQRVQMNIPAMPQGAPLVMQQSVSATPVPEPFTEVSREAPVEMAQEVTEDIVTDIAEPAVENVTEDVADSIMDTVTENIADAIADNSTENIADAVTDNATEDIADAVMNTVTEDIADTITDNVEETVTDTATDNIQEAVTDSVANNVTQNTEISDSDTGNQQLTQEEIAQLFASAEPSPKKETEPEDSMEEEKPFTPTFTVVGKEEPADDPNKQLSPDEIAALFAAADPAPKKHEKAEEPVSITEEPVADDPNKQLSADEIAALFAAAEPSPKKEEPVAKAPEPVKVEPVSDDPNKQLSPDEIAALFASLG